MRKAAWYGTAAGMATAAALLLPGDYLAWGALAVVAVAVLRRPRRSWRRAGAVIGEAARIAGEANRHEVHVIREPPRYTAEEIADA